jgi:hypothetical protein
MVIPIDEDIPSPGTENPCGFDILFHQEGNLRINYWTDKNGWWIKELDIWGNMKRIATAYGKTVKILVQSPGHYEFTYLPNEAVMQVKTTGAIAMVIAPGEGIIWGGAGLQDETYIFDTTDPNNWVLKSYSLDKLVGNEDFDPNWTEVCEYFRGDE